MDTWRATAFHLTDDVHPGGEVTEIHYWKNLLTDRRVGFKFQ